MEGYFVDADNFGVSPKVAQVTNSMVCPHGAWTPKALEVIGQSGLEPAFSDIANSGSPGE